MRRTAFAVILLFATAAGADALQEWKTPSGKIYFGDQPPAGSVAVKHVEKRLGKVAQPNPAPAAGPASRYVWRHDVECQDLRVAGVDEQPFGRTGRVIRGAVTHDGSHVVKDVRVCASAVCDELRNGNDMVNGESEDFRLDLEKAPPAEQIAVRVECSVREPG